MNVFVFLSIIVITKVLCRFTMQIYNYYQKPVLIFNIKPTSKLGKRLRKRIIYKSNAARLTSRQPYRFLLK